MGSAARGGFFRPATRAECGTYGDAKQYSEASSHGWKVYARTKSRMTSHGGANVGRSDCIGSKSISQRESTARRRCGS